MNSFIPIFSAFFILPGLLVWRFPKLIAGYNTMTPEKQKDEASAIHISSIVVPIIGVIYLPAGDQRYDHN